MGSSTARIVLVLIAAAVLLPAPAAAQGQPDHQLTIAFDVSIAPAFLDPADTPGIATPFVFAYALHDALLKPLPGNDMAPCLAESWKESPDGLTYEFKLRENLRFHNGDPFTAEDVRLYLFTGSRREVMRSRWTFSARRRTVASACGARTATKASSSRTEPSASLSCSSSRRSLPTTAT